LFEASHRIIVVVTWKIDNIKAKLSKSTVQFFWIFSECYKKNLKQNQIKGEKSGKPWWIEGSLVAEASNLRLQR